MNARLSIVLPALLLCCCLADAARAEHCTYVSIRDVDGESADKGHEGWIKTDEVYYDLDRDTGKKLIAKLGIEKRPRSLVFIKTLDKASPQLARQVKGGEKITKVTLHFVKTEGGKETHYFTITLRNVTITSLKLRPSETKGAMPREEVHMDYEEMALKSETGNTQSNFQDD